ncbi:hypothetical protein KOL70_22915 [Pantoea sp. B270]|uniref:hypothetical protein n=1 Tax=Pantoea sp. B270 TaxID=2836826 RepID=UPI001BFF6805|nr:hypothetical protein [Pantoea sp. B270]MBU6520800.1 hypothetical protein [Pantoea sp. B270]
MLERVSGGRHDFNRIGAWQAGQVVLSGDRYLSVTGVSVRLSTTASGDVAVPATVIRQIQEELTPSRAADKSAQPDIPSSVLANTARELERQTQLSLPPEPRGREPDRELPAPEITRHIQKER